MDNIPGNDIPFLMEIVKNILYRHDETKYHCIRLNILSTKLDDYKICLQYLCKIGFKQSANGKQLIWENTEHNMKMLPITLNSLFSTGMKSLLRPAAKTEPKWSKKYKNMNSYVTVYFFGFVFYSLLNWFLYR